MSLSDVHVTIGEDLWVRLGEIARWTNRNISSDIQKLEGAKKEDSVVQILNDALELRKNRITTVGNKGEDAIRLSGDFVDERDRGGNQTWAINYRKEAWAGIHNYMNE